MFNEWLQAKGFDPEALRDNQRTSLLAMFQAETAPKPDPAPAPAPAPAPEPQADDGDGLFDQKMKVYEAEAARVKYISDKTELLAERYSYSPDRLKQLREMHANAVKDKTCATWKFDLSVERWDRWNGPILMAPAGQQTNDTVLEAAICVSLDLGNVEKKFNDQTLQAAHDNFRRGLGLKELLSVAAERNSGYRGSDRDIESLCRAAFVPRNRHGFGPMATGGSPSTIDVPGILGNVGNKFLANGFNYTEQSWRQIAKIRSANDFKQMSTYRLTGSNKFEKVLPGGQIKHGTLSELTYTNQVETYGKMLGIDRRDVRNDDLNAFASAADELGRGAGDSLNEIFWTEWLDDSTFFPTDKSLANYDDGATDSVLSLAGLDNANAIFKAQTKPDGSLMGLRPRILLVPPALWSTAKNLMNGQFTASAQSTATVTTNNVWAGMFEVVESAYLQSTAITGNSATAWYLLADPMNVAAIEVAFLDGIQTPTVETSEFDFDRLGISMRAYHDVGVAKQEYRAGVKLKGAA